MSPEPELLAQCALRAAELARRLRQDQEELQSPSAKAGDAEGARLVCDIAASLERIAELASNGTPKSKREPT